MKSIALAMLGAAVLASAPAASPAAWQLAPPPALAPGVIGSWDDFAITGASILKTGESVTMFYSGIALASDARTSAIGSARSLDAVAWTKEEDNPVLGLEFAPEDYVASVSVAKWKNAFRAVFVLARKFTATAADENEPPPRVLTARSEDGVLWQRPEIFSGIAFDPPDTVGLRPCVYADSALLHLWWIGSDEGKPALCHSVSRDGASWSKPNRQLLGEIDSRPVSCVRVYPSGDFTLLVYVARDDLNHANIVTKIARDAHSWVAHGPPDFPLAWSGVDPVPEMLFTAEGARLFYSEPQYAQGISQGAIFGAVLRTAFCPKRDYVTK